MDLYDQLKNVSLVLRGRETAVYRKVLAETRSVEQALSKIEEQLEKGWTSTQTNVSETWKLEQAWRNTLYRQQSAFIDRLTYLRRLEQSAFDQARAASARSDALDLIVKERKRAARDKVLKGQEERLSNLSVLAAFEKKIGPR